MVNHHRVATFMADQVVVVFGSRFVNDAAAANVSDQRQTVVNQKIQCAIDRGLGHARQSLGRQVEDLRGAQVPAGFLNDLQDGQSLGSQAKTVVA